MHKSILTMGAGAMALALLSGQALAANKAVPTPTLTPTTTPVVAPAAEAPKPEPKKVEVQAGDSLSTIAEAQAMESWRPLWNANTGLENPDLIYPGQQLVVPEGATEDRPLPAGVVVEPVAVSRPVTSNTVVRRSTAANYAQGAGGVLERIRMRESGGNYAINTGNGYYGAYQFDLRTWRGVGGTGLPSEASPAEQDMRAQMLYDRRGCSPWPNTCY